MSVPRWLLVVTTSIGLAISLTSGQVVAAMTLPPTLTTVTDGDVTEYEWMLDAVNAQQAWIAATGSGTVVALIDTGVDSSHPDLDTQVVPGAMVASDAQGHPILVPATVEETSDDWYGHGSHVAGIIAGDDDGSGMTGIAPGAKIMPIAMETGVLRNEIGFLRMVRAGIDYAVANGADVINMSLGYPSSAIADVPKTHPYVDQLARLCDAVDAATAAGTVVVASAGNSGDWGNPEMVPASCPTAVTVAALAPSLDRTYWSSFDAAVDLAAPGQDILSVSSTVAGLSPTPHLLASGTSMAAPVVAGTAALIRSLHPGWSADQIADKLRASAQDLGVPGRDPDTGFGLVDAAAALNVAVPLADPSDFFTTWAEFVYGGTGGATVVGWMTPQAHAVSGYTVTVHTQTGTTDYVVDGQTVRTQVVMHRGDGWTVTAHTTAGDVTTYPSLYRVNSSGGEKPESLTHVKLDRQGRALIVSWDKPVNRDLLDRIEAFVYIERRAHRFGRIDINQSGPFPSKMRVELPEFARGYDVRVGLELTNTDENDRVIGGRWQRVSNVSPAPHGSRIVGVLSAGRRAAEVTGGVSPVNAQRVCDNHSCSGQLATLVIDRGSEVQRVSVRYNASGEFHATIWTPKGAQSVRLRIDGPRRLDSGPFRRVAIEH